MSQRKKQIRDSFRSNVFKRDKYLCAIPECDKKAVDAHHITDRNEMPNGGYVKENGISLCEQCHLRAEEFHVYEKKQWFTQFHPNDLYKLIGSSYEQAIAASNKL